MRFGITDIFMKNIPVRDRIELYKKVGYDFIAFVWECDYEENMKIVNIARDTGIQIDDIHLKFDEVNLAWESYNNNFIDYVIKSIDQISQLDDVGKDVIIHITKKSVLHDYSDIGVENFRRLNDYAKNKGVRLCFENLKEVDFLVKLADDISDINICFDLGHAYLYMEDYFNFIGKFSDNIVTTHIHSNNGTSDCHFEILKGAIDIEKSIKEIIRTNTDKLHFEIYPKNRKNDSIFFEKFISDNLEKLKKIYSDLTEK